MNTVPIHTIAPHCNLHARDRQVLAAEVRQLYCNEPLTPREVAECLGVPLSDVLALLKQTGL